MKTVFVDSNVFLRFFAKDDPEHLKAAKALFAKAEAGRLQLVSGPPVLFEIAWTLRSVYHVAQDEILNILSAILSFPGMNILDAELAQAAVGLARTSGQEFADAYIAASAQHAKADAVATFNQKHLAKLGVDLYPL